MAQDAVHPGRGPPGIEKAGDHAPGLAAVACFIAAAMVATGRKRRSGRLGRGVKPNAAENAFHKEVYGNLPDASNAPDVHPRQGEAGRAKEKPAAATATGLPVLYGSRSRPAYQICTRFSGGR